MNINPDSIVNLVRDKSEAIRKILEILDRNQKQAEGCAKLRESLVRKEDPNHSEANKIHCLSVALGIAGKNSEDLMYLAQFILVYASSASFTNDAAQMANKLGKGEDALKAMFKAKMEGKI